MALTLGIAGPDLDLGEPDLDGSPGPLAEAPILARKLAAALAACGYIDASGTPGRSNADVATAAEVQNLLDTAFARPGLVVVHLLGHGSPGPGQTMLYVLGPDGATVQTSVSEWISRVELRSGHCGPVLLVLDVCYSGKAIEYQLQNLVGTPRQKAWVLAACSGLDPAYGGRLTQALTQVVEKFAAGDLRVDPSMRYIPLRRLFSEVDRMVQQMSRGSYPQQVHSSYVPLHADVDHLEFFPNPLWDPVINANDARGGLAADLTALLDEAFDPRHFMRRAGAAEAVFGQVGRGFFHGRAEQLTQLRGWVIGDGPALRFVTGKPGVGKSALLGVMVCAAHPALREATRNLWDRLPDVPPKVPEGSLAVVHARHRTVTQVIASIARQWQLPVPVGHANRSDKDGWRTGEELVSAFRQRASQDDPETTRLLVVDAIDEADRPAELITEVLQPLAAEQSTDQRPLCRILAAGRDTPQLQTLSSQADGAGGRIDLEAIPRSKLRPALTAYAKDLLGHGTPYESLPYAPAADTLAVKIAAVLTAGPGSESDPAPQRWGEFLVAGLYIRHVLDLPPVRELSAARALGEAVPRDLSGVFDLDLALPGTGLDERVLRATAQALAFAAGAGMPERVLQHAAAAFLPGYSRGERLISDDINKALDRLRFYLRREVDIDGSTLYRFFHQGLADQLLSDAENEDGPAPAGRVWWHLYSMIPAGPDGSRHWQYAEPYLLRHAVDHAVAAEQLDAVLQDASFLAHADPVTLGPMLNRLPTGPAAIYRASYSTHKWQSPSARAQILAVDAARYGFPDLARRLSGTALGHPLWATTESWFGRALIGHTAGVWTVTVGHAGDRDVVISGDAIGTVRVWDAVTGKLVGQPLTGHGGGVFAVAAGKAGDRDIIVSGGDDGTVRVWDAATGQLIRCLTDHTGGVFAVAAGKAGDRDIIVSGGEDGTVRVWDAATGQSVGKPLTGHMSPVWAVAVGCAGDRDIIVFGGSDGTVHDCDAVTGQAIGEPLTGRTTPVRAVAVGRAGHRDIIVAGGGDTITVWDTAFSGPISYLTGHSGGVLSVAVDRTGGQDIIISSGNNREARVWDAATGQLIRSLDHGGGVFAVAAGKAGDRDIIVSGGDDGAVRVWDTVTWRLIGPAPTSHASVVHALAAGNVGNRDVIISGSADRTVQMWETASGKPAGRSSRLRTAVRAVAIGKADDRDIVVACDADGAMSAWDAATGQLIMQTGHTIGAIVVAAGKAGDRDIIVSGGEDGTVRVWDAATGQSVGKPLTGHAARVLAVATGKAGGRDIIASSGVEGTMRVWDAVTGEAIGQSTRFGTWLGSVAVGRVGDRDIIVSGGEDGTVRVWDAASAQLIAHQQFPCGIHSLVWTRDCLAVAVNRDIVVIKANSTLFETLPTSKEGG